MDFFPEIAVTDEEGELIARGLLAKQEQDLSVMHCEGDQALGGNQLGKAEQGAVEGSRTREIIDAVSRNPASFTSEIAIPAMFSCDRRIASARPIPEAAPVMTTTLLVESVIAPCPCSRV